MTRESGPWRLVHQLRDWAEQTPWCQWAELGGSLGRGAGDELSDVDAGIGVSIDPGQARDLAMAAVSRFAPVAARIVQRLGDLDHLVLQYADGRQLSLVIFPGTGRDGLPPGSQVLMDRAGVLATTSAPARLTATPDQLREWAFLAWWSIGDVAKHAGRGSVWRAVESLHDARTTAWQLHAAALGIDYPAFGAVSVGNARRTAPDGMERTLPAAAEPAAILAAAAALGEVLDRLTPDDPDVTGIRRHALHRLTAAQEAAAK